MDREALLGWRRLTDEDVPDLAGTIASDIERLEGDGTKLTFYVGCDSHRRKRIITYAKVIAVRMEHESGGGMGVFCYYKKDKEPSGKIPHRDRLWNEVHKTVEVAQWLDEILLPLDHCVEELHADLNASPEYLSNCVASMCLGYIRSMGYVGVIKPDSWAADAADGKSK